MLSIEILTERKNGNNNEPLLNCLSLTGTSVNLTNLQKTRVSTYNNWLSCFSSSTAKDQSRNSFFEKKATHFVLLL